MDNKTTVNELKIVVDKFVTQREWNKRDNCKDLAIDMVNEANELHEIFCFKSENDIKEILNCPKKFNNIRMELADALWCVLRFASFCNIDLSTALHDKLSETATRYPVEKCIGNNKKYTEFE